jgi:hypothetical protein
VWLFFGKAVLLFVTIVVVWALYAYLHAYHLDWLGWLSSFSTAVSCTCWVARRFTLSARFAMSVRSAATLSPTSFALVRFGSECLEDENMAGFPFVLDAALTQ